MKLAAALLVVLGVLVAAAAAQAPAPIVLMISVDGLRPDYVTAADTHGLKIPALRRFVTEGAFAEGVEGVIPTVTYPSHTTLITGVWPAKHGILSNTIFDPLRTGQSAWYWYAEDIRVPTLWDAAARAGWTTASVHWPVSVGARVTWNIPEYWRANTPEDAKLLRALSTPGLLAELEAELGPYPRALEAEDDEARGRFSARLLEKKRPALLTLHLLALDHVQHDTRPFSAETFAVLERLDAVVGRLRETAERLAPGRAFVAIVSDHGFARTDATLNLFVAFRDAGLLTIERGRITDWKAIPWSAGGSAAIVLKDPADGVTREQTRALLDKLAAEPASGIDRVLDAATLHARGGFPPASFLVGLKPGWQMVSTLAGSMLAAGKGGTHGHLPEVAELRASFFLIGPGVPAGRALGLIDMRDVAPTLARRVGLSLSTADGKILLP
ncbi:MAG: alkaline phosphatase family protein [Candidatus Rokuibacteriota bacterium]|nr:MAG: alkaline phosphatase family protein [Candidatus Rokubacteria bacterium]